jgi:hypothetical protein
MVGTVDSKGELWERRRVDGSVYKRGAGCDTGGNEGRG